MQRTHKLIVEALLELTAEKGFAAVSVTDITERAGVNRATFYRHYADKFDVLDRYARSIYALLDAAPDGPDSDAITPGLARIFDRIREDARFYRVILGKNGDPGFADKIRQYIQKRIRRSLPADLKKDETWIELYVAYSSSASVGAVLWWLENGLPYSSEEMAALLRQLEGGNLAAM